MNRPAGLFCHSITLQVQQEIRARRIIYKRPVPTNPTTDIYTGAGHEVFTAVGLPHVEVFGEGWVVDHLCTLEMQTLRVDDWEKLNTEWDFVRGAGGEVGLFTEWLDQNDIDNDGHRA